MSETLSQIIAKMGTPAKPTGSTPKVPKEPKVPKVVQKARQTAVKRSPNPFVQAVEQAFKPTTPTKPQEPNLGQIIKQFKDVASSGRKQRGETLMQEYIRNTQPVSGNMGFKAGSGKGATIEAEMAAYDRKTFGAETYGKRPKGVSTAEWSKRQSHKGKFKQLAGTRNEQVAELDREIEAYKLENMTPVQRLELARETSGGLPGFYDKERASALAASLMGSQDLKDKTDASLFIRAANQVMQPVSTAYTVAMKDPRSLAEMPVGLQVGLSAGDLGAQIVGGFLTGGASTPATASTLARIGAVATRALALDAPGYIQMIEDAGGVDKALVAYKDMIGKALDPNSKISASERVNGIALAGMIVLSGGGKIAGKGPHADPNITTRLIETEAVPGSASDLRGQVGGVGLDAEPARRSVGEYADEIAAAAEANRGRSREPETQREQRSPSSDEKQLDLSQEPAAKSRKGVQEPWQKTLEQLRRGNSRVAKPGTPRYYESQPDYDLSKLIRSGDRMAIIEASKRSMERGFRSPGEWENAIQREADALRETHRDAIVKALAEGKRVPPEVLADYPLLKPAGRVDAEPALRPGGKEPVAGVEPEKDSRLKDLVEGFDEPEVEPLSDREKVRAAGGAVRKEDFPHLTDQQIIVANRGMPGATAKAEVKAARERIAAKGIQDLDPERIKAFNDEAEAVAAGRDEAWIDDHMIGKYETEIAELEAKGSPRSAGKLADLRSKLGEIKQRQAERVEMEAAELLRISEERKAAGTSSRVPELVDDALPDTNVARGEGKMEAMRKPKREASVSQGGYVQLPGKKADPLESLKQEARKYKSAEEFVKNNFVAHGTNKEILGNLQPTNGWYGKAVYTTDDLANASGRNGGGVTYFVNKPQGKLLEINAHGSKGGSGFTPQQYQDAIKNGYDGLKIKHDDGKTWYAMFNEQTPHTKQQLTDLYNQSKPSIKDKVKNSLKSLNYAAAKGGDRDAAMRMSSTQKVDDDTQAMRPVKKSAAAVADEQLKSIIDEVEKTVKVIQRLGELGVAHVEEAIRQFSEAIGRKLSKPEEAHFRKLWDENQAKPKAEGEPEVPEAATGLARQFTDQERFARELEETKAPAQSVQKLVDATQAEWGDGGHIKAELALRRGNEPGFNPTRDQIVKDTAMVAHLKREVKNEYDRLLRKDDPTPQDMADIQAVEAKLNEIDEYAQKIRTHWHDVGMALQIAYKPDFTVADLTMRARAANGGDISPDAQKQINDWVSKYEAAQKELDELRKAKPPKEVSGVAVSKPRAARAAAVNRLANLGLEVRGEDGALVAPTKGGGMKGGKQAGAVTIPKLTPSMENELRKSIRQIAKAYIVDEHPIAGSLDGVVTLVRKHLPSLSEEDILRYLSDRYHRVLLDSDLQRRESQAFMRRIQAAADYRNKTLLEKGFAQAGALLNTTQRGLQASMDLSAPFRQGRRVMVTKEWVNAWLPSTKAMFAKDPQKAMELHSAELARSPYYSKGVESGLGISSASKPEEVWAGRLLQDWAAGKGLAAGKANPLRAYANLIQRSEAHYTIFLNDLRMRLFENLAKRNPNDKEYLESIAQMINVMTGRGHGKTATMLSHPAAGNVFYAPRYAWSEVQSTGMVPIWKTKSKMARQEAIKAYGRNFAVTVVGLSLARLFGNEVELDPRGTDFLKVRLQNGKVVDVLGASQQYLRLLVRMGYGSVSRKGFYSEPGAFGADPLMQAVNNKLSPAARSLLGLLRGWASPNADGDWQKQPPGMVLRDSVTPMGARKTGDQMWSDGDKWALLNLLGIDYEKGQPNKRQKKGSRPPKLEGLPQGMRQFAGHAPITGR